MEVLLQRGETRVKGFDLAEPKRSLQSSVSATFVQGSVTDYAAVKAACADVDVVFTTVAMISFYERLPWQYASSHAVNVAGTANIIQACIECGVQVLVQTSSSNVCVAAELVSLHMNEDSPYVDAKISPNHYGWTKVQAEKAVLAANGTQLANGHGCLATGVCRPCSAIFGPLDNLITEKFIREGHMRMMVPEPTIDYVFVDNVVWGHLLLEKQLHENPRTTSGQAFCISNEDPIVADDFMAGLAFFYEQALKQPMKVTYLPRRLLEVLGWCAETYQRISGRRIQNELKQLTPAMFAIASLSYAFSSAKAKAMLGYKPLYTVEEGLQKTMADWVASAPGKTSIK